MRQPHVGCGATGRTRDWTAGEAVALIVLLGLVAGLAPGLGEVRSLRGRASAGWLVVAIGLEVASSLSYVAMFRPAFCHRMRWRSSADIGLSELGVSSIMPAAEAGVVALGAWIPWGGRACRRRSSRSAASRSC